MRGYRADIDGLRALAVIPIVAFHLGIQRAGGGYVGVDIFFVISGYLVGGHVLAQIRSGTYSVLEFYVRRFRRIVPALAFCLLVTTVAVFILLLPTASDNYGRSLISTVLFGSNFYFWSTSGYFAADSISKPLLHTWSLSIEEQFYILFPLLVLSLRRFGSSTIITCIITLAIGSLLLSIATLHQFPSATFYLLPTRLWELLLGVLAVLVPPGLFASPRRSEAASWCGLALVAGAILFYRPDTPFPGLTALPPCFGTALLLCGGAANRSSVARLLSLPPVVFFGLISYSLYLWHWPVIVLLQEGLPTSGLSFPLKIVAFGLSVMLGWVSWRFVERPWRDPRVQAKTVVAGTFMSGALLGSLALAFISTRGFPARYDPQIVRIAAFTNNSASNDFRDGTCFISSAYRFSDFDRRSCLASVSTKPNVLLIGDSHAAHLWTGLQRRYPYIHFQQATASGCKAVLDRPAGVASRCEQMMQFLFDTYLPSRKGSWVILAGSWDEHDASAVGKTLNWLREEGLKVILAGPIARYRAPLPQLMALATKRHDTTLVDRSRETDASTLDALYARIASEHGARYMSPYRALCNGSSCRTADANGLPLQFDYGHLTRSGSLMVANQFPAEAIRDSEEWK